MPPKVTEEEYKGILFDRKYKEDDAMKKVLGVGHRLFDKALELAMRQTVCVTLVPEKILQCAVFVFKVSDRVTTKGTRASVLFGVKKSSDQEWDVLSDWVLLRLLNDLSSDRGQWKRRVPVVSIDGHPIANEAQKASAHLTEALDAFHLDFTVPEVELMGILWPGTAVAEKEIPETIDTAVHRTAATL